MNPVATAHEIRDHTTTVAGHDPADIVDLLILLVDTPNHIATTNETRAIANLWSPYNPTMAALANGDTVHAVDLLAAITTLMTSDLPTSPGATHGLYAIANWLTVGDGRPTT